MSFKLSNLRALSVTSISAAIAVSALAWSAGAGAQTITAVMHSGLRVVDPILSTAFITRNHGYMIYDTLFGMDANYKIQPQMVEKWDVSADKKTYVFVLRDGLKWHDGTPVDSEDCVASIKRWAKNDSAGQMLMPMVSEIKVIDAKTFQVVLTEPTGLLMEGLSKLSSVPAFMMPKRVAETPASESIKDFTGSGPFKFNVAAFKPGLNVLYEKNLDYVPRSEPSSWTAGGKVVNVDKVNWVAMPDQMTAVNALLNGEADYMEHVPFDLLPLLQGKDNVKVDTLDRLGSWTYYRMNHLQAPFNNKKVRQAAMHAVSQERVLKAVVGDPKYYKTCASVFGCGNPYANSYGEEVVVPGNLDKARALLKESGYDGTPVVILHPTDIAITSPPPVVIADALRKAGFTVDLKAMDWQTVVTLRSNQKPVSEGGWSIFTTYANLATSGDPIGNATVAAAGKKSWAGWPDVPEVEALRLQFTKATDVAERKEITAKIQKLAIDEGMVGPLGQFVIPAAYSTKLTGLLDSPVSIFWNVKKGQ